MKKKLFKIMALAGLAAMMTVGFAGCKKTECFNCEEMKRCKPFDDYTLGEINLCEECRALIEPMSNRFKEFFEGTE